MSKVLMEARGLKKSFKKDGVEIRVLRGVDFKIHEGEMVAVTGPSGVGKSTLLHILGTLEPPTEGKVYFGPERHDLFAMKERDLSQFRNRFLGFIFQFHYLLPEFTALENVMLPALIAGMGRSAAEAQAKDLLGFVGLGKRLSHRPSELSGGEQQRVAIARAVILRPQILLADELTGNLDSTNSGIVLDLLTRLSRERGIAVLMVTHDLDLSRKMHRVMPMKDGVFVG